VAYLNGSKVLTTGSALVFDGTNLGVGVTPSAWATYKAIDVLGYASFSSYNGNEADMSTNAYYNAGWKYKNTAAAALYQQDTGVHRWQYAASGTAGNAITWTQAMTLDASGNLGIGTTSPVSRLEIKDTTNNTALTVTSSYEASLQLVNGGGSEVSVINAGGSNILSLRTANNEKARIDSSGNLLVGTTTTDPSTNAFTFQPSSKYGVFSHAPGTSSGTVFTYFSYAGNAIGSVSQNGTTGVLYNLTSDYRLKNDQQALTGAKDFVMALKPKKWQWWDGSGEGVGFVAHEFMEVAKHSGHGEKDAVDADGKPKYQSIQPSSSEVMANLVAFIQEQQALIQTLTARITALESA
jgi:hypothetical protein